MNSHVVRPNDKNTQAILERLIRASAFSFVVESRYQTSRMTSGKIATTITP